MSDARGPDQYRTNLSTASTILGLTLFAALCISLCIRQYFVATSGCPWPWSPRPDPHPSVDRRISSSDDEPRTIAIGGRAKNLRIPLMWDAYIQADGLLRVGKTKGKTVKSPFHSELADLQPVSVQMLTPHAAGPFTPGIVLRESAHATPPVTPPLYQIPPNTPQPPPRAVLHPHGAPPTPRFQPQTSPPQGSTPATPHLHASVHISFPSASTPAGLNPQGLLAPNPSDLSPNPPLASTLASHPLQLTFLLTLPDPSFPTYLPPPSSLQTPLPPTASSLSPTFGILTPSPTFLLPSLIVPAESLTSWWDLPDEPSSAEGNRAPGWESRLRELQEARESIRRRDDVALALRWQGRAIGRRA